jgi:hypothetical protein
VIKVVRLVSEPIKRSSGNVVTRVCNVRDYGLGLRADWGVLQTGTMCELMLCADWVVCELALCADCSDVA